MEENNVKKSNKKLLGLVAALVVVAAVLFAVFTLNKPQAQKGSKHITIEVTNMGHETTDYDVYTDAEFLSQAMDETQGLSYSGTESEYGLFIDTVNGETADYSVDCSYWAIFVNGEYGMYGADQQPVTDGDTYSLVYTIG